MKDRILQFLALESLSPTRFADQLGVQRSGVSHILAGRNKPSYDFIEKMLLTFPNINAEWLLLGKGEMYKAAAKSASPSLSLFEEHSPQKEVSVSTTQANEKNEDKKSAPERLEVEKSAKLQHAIAQNMAAENPENPKKTVESITIFYTDKTFCAYRPE
ncbi:MAG: helix-turn-helix domain-containing protein [Prevotellaceae bacterium]|jgi:transcriptional regulator with XRE-family HTH domain|nr:helix-turn-helix domain-containing protein [Prevotellaceae bacterium]